MRKISLRELTDFPIEYYTGEPHLEIIGNFSHIDRGWQGPNSKLSDFRVLLSTEEDDDTGFPHRKPLSFVQKLQHVLLVGQQHLYEVY